MFPVLIVVELIIQCRCHGPGYLLLTGNKLWSLQIGNNMDTDFMQITVDRHVYRIFCLSYCHFATSMNSNTQSIPIKAKNDGGYES